MFVGIIRRVWRNFKIRSLPNKWIVALFAHNAALGPEARVQMKTPQNLSPRTLNGGVQTFRNRLRYDKRVNPDGFDLRLIRQSKPQNLPVIGTSFHPIRGS